MSSFACIALTASCSVDDSFAGNMLNSIFINTKYYCCDGKKKLFKRKGLKFMVQT